MTDVLKTVSARSNGYTSIQSKTTKITPQTLVRLIPSFQKTAPKKIEFDKIFAFLGNKRTFEAFHRHVDILETMVKVYQPDGIVFRLFNSVNC